MRNRLVRLRFSLRHTLVAVGAIGVLCATRSSIISNRIEVLTLIDRAGGASYPVEWDYLGPDCIWESLILPSLDAKTLGIDASYFLRCPSRFDVYFVEANLNSDAFADCVRAMEGSGLVNKLDFTSDHAIGFDTVSFPRSTGCRSVVLCGPWVTHGLVLDALSASGADKLSATVTILGDKSSTELQCAARESGVELSLERSVQLAEDHLAVVRLLYSKGTGADYGKAVRVGTGSD